MRLFIAFICSLAFISCTPAESEQLLTDDELAAAIPLGFELDRIVRNDLEFERKGWVTVGVRLEPKDINYARAIFYVLPTEADARRLYRQQSGTLPPSSRIASRSDDRPQPPFSVAGVARPNLCVLGGGENLWICHATAGRFYLVTQSSSAERLWPPDFEPGTDRHARLLLAAFAPLLEP